MRSIKITSLVISMVAATTASAAPQSLKALGQTLSNLEGEISRVKRDYEGAIDLGFKRSFSDRASGGELYYLLDEYERASISLFGAVDPSFNHAGADKAGYAEALYQLADSLLQLGNYGASETYFSELLSLPRHSFRTQAISGLLKIADRTEDFTKVDQYFNIYKSATSNVIPSDVRYIHAKSLFLAERDTESIEELSRIAPGDPYFMRARYLVGATIVREGKLKEALKLFEELAKEKPVAKEDIEVSELVQMARGRLLYELDQLDESIDAFQYVSWESEHLDDMLYELTWTYVRRGQLVLRDSELLDQEKQAKAQKDYELALSQLEDLALLSPQEEGVADISLLRGNLELQGRDYDAAGRTFDLVLAEYGPADEKLATMLDDPEAQRRVLNSILAVDEGGLSVDNELPAVALRRATEDPDVANAVSVFKDLRTSQSELEIAEEKLQVLQEILGAQNRGERFPQLRNGFVRAFAVDNNLLKVMTDLAEHAERKTRSRTGSARLAQLRQQRKAMTQQIATLPTTSDAVEARKGRFDTGFRRLEAGLHESELVLEHLRAQLAAVDLLYRQSKLTQPLPQRIAEKQVRKIKSLRQEIDDLEGLADTIRSTIAKEKIRTTLSGGKEANEREIRTAYTALVWEELREAESVSGGATSDVTSLARRAMSIHNAEREFVAKLNGAADVYMNDVRGVVSAEAQNLQAYRSQIEAVNLSANSIREQATALALATVREELNDVVLRGDVGVIDVAFGKKQSQTEKIGNLKGAKSEELTDLSQAFADLNADEVD